MSILIFGDSCPAVTADEQARRYQQCMLCPGPMMPFLVVVVPIPEDDSVDQTRTRVNGRVFWSKISWTAYRRGLAPQPESCDIYCLDRSSQEEIHFILNALSDRAIAQMLNINTLPIPHDLQAVLDEWKRTTGRLYQPPREPVIVQRQPRRPKKRKSGCIIQ